MDSLFTRFKPDNYTAQQRTPWAGSRVVKTVKGALDCHFPKSVGEFWEFSTCSQLPSVCDAPQKCSFRELLQQHGDTWLSAAHRALWGNDTPMLIKYIDAALDLSLQLHPPIQADGLEVGCCGKWESWLILGHAPSAGIYLGLAPGVTKARFLEAIERNLPLKPLLHFVPVRRGEVYTIPPCTIHSLGADVCVIEPQLLMPGKSAVSLRLHDWNRLYDASGNLSANGSPRALHIQQALEFIDFNAPRGRIFSRQMRCLPDPVFNNRAINVYQITHAPCLRAKIIEGSGDYSFDLPGELTALMVIQGKVEFTVDGQTYRLRAGESGAIAASAQKARVVCNDCMIYLARCIPGMFCQTCGYCR